MKYRVTYRSHRDFITKEIDAEDYRREEQIVTFYNGQGNPIATYTGVIQIEAEGVAHTVSRPAGN